LVIGDIIIKRFYVIQINGLIIENLKNESLRQLKKALQLLVGILFYPIKKNLFTPEKLKRQI